MFKRIVTLLFSSFIIIIHAQNLDVVVNSMISGIEEAKQKLAPIQHHEALPVVFFETELPGTQYTLQVPEEVVGAMTLEKKMVHGTSFYKTGSEMQLFFCPKLNSNEKCLVPQHFENFTRLKCFKEPTPVVVDEIHPGTRCSLQNGSTFHSMAYDICPSEAPYKYEKLEFKLYKFCYDNQNQKTIFTTHIITSPKLLEAKLLFREQQLSYPYSIDDRFQTANFEDIKNSLSSEIMSFIEASKPLYQVQKLVPSEDMPLGTWKTPTYQFVNLELQHKWLSPFWNEINDKVREEAIRVYDNGISFYVATGVFDITTDIRESAGQIYNMWVKVITSVSRDTSEFMEAIVFVMNNFLDFITDDPQLIFVQTKIFQYCPNNLCDYSFKIRVGGRVLCCQTTMEIAQLFGSGVVRPNLPGLQISDLTEIPD